MNLISRLLEAPLEEALGRAIGGEPLLLRCRRSDTATRLCQVAEITHTLHIVEVAEGRSPERALLAAISGRHETLRELVTDPDLDFTLFLARSDPTTSSAWSAIAGLWASIRASVRGGPSLCVLNFVDKPPQGCQSIDDGALAGPAESLMLARSFRRTPSLLAEAADQVVIECARGDLDLLMIMLQLPEPTRFNPLQWLERQPATTTPILSWRGDDADCPTRLARKAPHEVRRRVWFGQATVLFPALEMKRANVIGHAGDRLAPGEVDAETGLPLERIDYEWGLIARLLKSLGRNNFAGEAHQVRLLRNALAHGSAVSYSEAQRALTAADRLLSAFPR